MASCKVMDKIEVQCKADIAYDAESAMLNYGFVADLAQDRDYFTLFATPLVRST